MAQNSEKFSLEGRPRTDGMTVPEGFFADFAERMTAMLPERPELESPSAAARAAASAMSRRARLWAMARPYVYMAAMFAGVWCMLHLFNILSSPAVMGSMDTNPVVAEAFSNDSFVRDYVYDDISQWDIIDEMVSDGVFEDAPEGVSIADMLQEDEEAIEDESSSNYLLPASSTSSQDY